MMRVRCPHCGYRDLSEFVWGGEADVRRPANAASETDTGWTDYLYFRSSVAGVARERWQHIHGCRAWFEATRDTVTHRWIDG